MINFTESKYINTIYDVRYYRVIIIYKLVCPCGKEFTITHQKAKKDTICKGCSITRSKTKHGMANTPTYVSWKKMIDRCTKNEPKYLRYKEKGIVVCDRWLESFENFYQDMGERPKGKTLDRINSSGNYEIENCRWSNWNEQSRNKENNHWVVYKGERYVINDLAAKFGIYGSLLAGRLKLGWSLDKALTTPAKKILPWGFRKYKILSKGDPISQDLKNKLLLKNGKNQDAVTLINQLRVK